MVSRSLIPILLEALLSALEWVVIVVFLCRSDAHGAKLVLKIFQLHIELIVFLSESPGQEVIPFLLILLCHLNFSVLLLNLASCCLHI